MNKLVAAAVGSALILSSVASAEQPATAAPPQKVIIDLDIEADTDDVGALAVLHAMADAGEVEILAITVDTTAPWGPSAVDAINTYYGRPDIPIGQYKGPSFNTPGSPGAYAETVSREFPQTLGTPPAASATPDAVTLLRSTLTAQPDDSVVVVALGFLNNLRGLLESAGGPILVDQKVKTLSVMGGYYPSGKDDFNFGLDEVSAGKVINGWPGYILFSGLGGDVGTGPRLATETPAASPTRRAYGIFPGASVTRPSWDQISVIAGVRGAAGPFGSVRGRNAYDMASEYNSFTSSSSGPHAYLTLTTSTSGLARQIDDLMVHRPPSGRPTNGVYRLTAAHSSKVLGIAGCTSTGAVAQVSWADTACQKWRLTAVGGGDYSITSELTGKVLDVWNASSADGAVVVQHPWLSGANQSWSLGAVSGGRVRIIAAHSGRNLDVANVSSADGAQIWQYRWLGGTNQQWTLQYLAP